MGDLIAMLDPASIPFFGWENESNAYIVFISLHALFGIISLLSGSLAMNSFKGLNGKAFDIYHWALVGMIAFLACAMVIRLPEYTNIEFVAYPGLFLLSLYMYYRSRGAKLLFDRSEIGSEYIHHIGFTLIALFEGFIIVAMINASAAPWLIGVVAIIVILVGRRMMNRAEKRLHI